jgi:hypothetical protein
MRTGGRGLRTRRGLRLCLADRLVRPAVASFYLDIMLLRNGVKKLL